MDLRELVCSLSSFITSAKATVTSACTGGSFLKSSLGVVILNVASLAELPPLHWAVVARFEMASWEMMRFLMASWDTRVMAHRTAHEINM